MANRKIKSLFEALTELELEAQDDLEIIHPSGKKKKSHVVKKSEEQAKDMAIQKLQEVLDWLETIDELDGYTKHNILTRAEAIVKKILG